MTTSDTGMRQRKRDSLYLSAIVGVADRTPRETRVRNLSSGGMMIDVASELPVGTAVTIQLRGVEELTGHVAWCTAGRAGIAFDREIDPTVPRAQVTTGKSQLPDYLRIPPGRRPGLGIR